MFHKLNFKLNFSYVHVSYVHISKYATLASNVCMYVKLYLKTLALSAICWFSQGEGVKQFTRRKLKYLHVLTFLRYFWCDHVINFPEYFS